MSRGHTETQEHTPDNSYRALKVKKRIAPNLPELPSAKSLALTSDFQATAQHPDVDAFAVPTSVLEDKFKNRKHSHGPWTTRLPTYA